MHQRGFESAIPVLERSKTLWPLLSAPLILKPINTRPYAFNFRITFLVYILSYVPCMCSNDCCDNGASPVANFMIKISDIKVEITDYFGFQILILWNELFMHKSVSVQ
jgi:hypothetical protein